MPTYRCWFVLGKSSAVLRSKDARTAKKRVEKIYEEKVIKVERI